MSRASREVQREQIRAELLAAIPRSYDHRLHLLLPTLLGAALCVAAGALVRDLRPLELLTVPAMLLLSNGAEWLAHRYMLHERIPFLEHIYVRHEIEHHAVYTHEDMAMRSPRELRLILVPAYAVLVLLVSIAPWAALGGLLLGPNCALLAVITSLVYFVTYEWLHLSYHLPSDHPVARNRVIARLRRLHQTHHDPRLMKRYNFNVTFGLFDRIAGTLYDPERDPEQSGLPGRVEQLPRP